MDRHRTLTNRQHEPEGGCNFATLHKRADTARCGAKERGKNDYPLYDGPAEALVACWKAFILQLAAQLPLCVEQLTLA